MIERKIIIGCITSTEFLKKINSVWNSKYIESNTARQLAAWCWTYFKEYDRAPGRDIETIFFEQLRQGGIPHELAEDIEQNILPGLSQEYENEEFNIEYLIKITNQYFKERKLLLQAENIKSLVDSGEVDEAEKVITNYTPVNIIPDLDSFIQSISQIRKKKKPHTIIFMKPWLKSGQVSIIYSKAGVGKTLLSALVAYVVGLKDYDKKETDIGEWQVKTPTGTLYIDGEMGEQEMLERISQFEWLGRQNAVHSMKILAVPEYQLETEDSFYLSDRNNQLKIIKWLRINPTYKLIVLDSVSTLFGLKEENDNSEWSTKVNPFLRDLKALDVACIMLHHAGKDNKKGVRGASAIEAMVHNIFRLTPHEAKNPEGGEAWFILSKDKQRSSGHGFKTFSLRFYQNDNEKQTHWEITKNSL
jgi:hypothetical protein